jgi:lipid-A-disaccharide synthase
MPKKIMIIAGESSGDFHSASLISELKRMDPALEISGMGGPKMKLAGCHLLFDIAELAIIGFTGVLTNLKKIKQVFNMLLAKIDQERPNVVVLVDYPGFNLKLAREIKKRNIPVIYYISPQIWAWWKGRIHTIKRFVDKMIVVFKFEKELYQDYGIDVSFVGHPLLDIAQPGTTKEEFLNRSGLPAQNISIGLVPGSRRMEIERILPILLKSARIIKQKLPQAQFLILQAPEQAQQLYSSEIKKSGLPAVLCENQTYDFLNACDFVLVASGTATLETAIMQKPMIVVYKVSFLNWLIARCLIKLPFIGLVNVVGRKLIVPEFVQYRARPELIAEKALEMLGNQSALTEVKQHLSKVRQRLGSPGASQRAAKIIIDTIG